MSELFGYNTDLRSMTGGIGLYEYEFSRYEQAPGDIRRRKLRPEQPKSTNWTYNLWIPEDRFPGYAGLIPHSWRLPQQRSSLLERCLSRSL